MSLPRDEEGTAVGYFILRNGLQHGPYSFDDVQHFLRTGELCPGDLSRTEAMKQWLPLSEITGAPLMDLKSKDQGHGVAAVLSEAIARARSEVSRKHPPPRVNPDAAAPPRLHWGFLLLLTVTTLGLFGWFWSFRFARWARKVDARNQAMLFLVISLTLAAASLVLLFAIPKSAAVVGAAAVMQIAAVVMLLFAMFALRLTIFTCYFPQEDARSLDSGLMTIFFNIFYLQYKLGQVCGPGQQATPQ